MQEPQITLIGNVGAPPRLRVLASGAVVTDFRVASTPRKQDRSTGAWSDLATIWFTVTCWKGLAENVAGSLKTGDRVVVTGQLRANVWTTDKGEERSGLEVLAQTVGFDLSRGRAVQERGVPLTLTTDPGGRPVDDPVADPDEPVHDDDVSIGEPVTVAA